jgi:tetrahydromethanopterin S-methyltransferase subunit G
MANDDDGPENFTLRYLREIDRKLDRVLDRFDTLTSRVAGLEKGFAFMIDQVMTLPKRLDGVDQRLDRIERRLGLVNAPPTSSVPPP